MKILWFEKLGILFYWRKTAYYSNASRFQSFRTDAIMESVFSLSREWQKKLIYYLNV